MLTLREATISDQNLFPQPFLLYPQKISFRREGPRESQTKRHTPDVCWRDLEKFIMCSVLRDKIFQEDISALFFQESTSCYMLEEVTSCVFICLSPRRLAEFQCMCRTEDTECTRRWLQQLIHRGCCCWGCCFQNDIISFYSGTRVWGECCLGESLCQLLGKYMP